jgi:ABC-type transport system involved in multi-copper enzyme maturation permease subunit
MPILTIARLTLREASRRKLLLAVAILTAALCVLTGWGFHKLTQLGCGGTPCSHAQIRDGVSAMLILLVFMFSFILALGAAFVASPAISGDVESGLMLAILPRPIRRSDVVIGKWLGLGVLVALYAAIACTLEFVIVRIATGYLPPHPFTGIVYIVGEGMVVLTLTLVLSTRLPAMTSGIIVLVLFGMTWMAGIAGALGAAFNNIAIEDVGTVSSLLLPTDALWRGALFNLEPALMIAGSRVAVRSQGNAFLALDPPTTAMILWALLWIGGMLAAAVWSFQRREL